MKCVFVVFSNTFKMYNFFASSLFLSTSRVLHNSHIYTIPYPFFFVAVISFLSLKKFKGMSDVVPNGFLNPKT